MADNHLVGDFSGNVTLTSDYSFRGISQTGEEPAIGGRDNLKTMALVEAAYRSVSEHRAIELSEIK